MAISEELTLELGSALASVATLRGEIEAIGPVKLELVVENEAAITSQVEQAVEAADTTVVIQPELDPSGITDATAQIQDSSGEASEAVGGIGESAKSSGNEIVAMGSKAAALVGVAVGIKEIVQGAFEAVTALETVRVQSESALRALPEQADLSAASIRELAQTTEDLTTVDDKAVQAASNLILRLGDLQTRGGSLQTVLDQATEGAVDLSSALGRDLGSSAQQLARALADPIRGLALLARSGIKFEAADEIRRLAEAGELAAAQQLILDEVTRRFGGSAEALANTLQGDLNRAVDQLEDAALSLTPVLEFGVGVIGLVGEAAKVAAPLVGALADQINRLPKFPDFGPESGGPATGTLIGLSEEEAAAVDKRLEASRQKAEQTATEIAESLRKGTTDITTIEAELARTLEVTATSYEERGFAVALSSRNLIRALQDEGVAVDENRILVEASGRTWLAAADAVHASDRAVQTHERSLLDIAQAEENLASKIDDRVAALGRVFDAENRGADIALDVIKSARANAEAQQDLIDSRDKFNAAVAEGTSTEKELRDLRRDIEDDTIAAAEAYQQLTRDVGTADAQLKESGKSTHDLVVELTALLSKTAATPEEITAITDAVVRMSSDINVGEDAAVAYARAIDALKQSGVELTPALLAAIDAVLRLNSAISSVPREIRVPSVSTGLPGGGGVNLSSFQPGPKFNAELSDTAQRLAQFTAAAVEDEQVRQDAIDFTLEKMREQFRLEAEGNTDLARIRQNEIDFRFEQILTAKEQIAILDQAIAETERFTDRWVELNRERQRLIDDEARAAEDAADDIARAEEQRIRDVEQAAEQASARLDQLVRQEEALAKRRVDIETRAAADILRAEQQLAKDRAGVQAQLKADLAEQNKILSDAVAGRRAELDSFASITDRFAAGPSLSAAQLIRNAEAQNAALEEFGAGLAEARARGVSEATIAALDLTNPQNLGQLRRVLAASQAEIDKLNSELAERGAIIGVQAKTDTAGVAAEVEAVKILAGAAATAAVDALESAFTAEKGRITEAARIALVAIDAEAAAIGLGAGVSLGQNIAKGITSTNPVIRKAAQDAQAAAVAAGFPIGAAGVTVYQVYVAPGGSVDDALRARR